MPASARIRRALLGAVLAWGTATAGGEPVIDTPEPVRLLKDGAAQFVLVDVRAPRETAVSIIPGAITREAFERDPVRYRGRLVIPYCTIGVRSGDWARRLARDGWRVRNYEGSILAWAAAGQPLVTPAGQPTRRLHTFNGDFDAPPGYVQVTD